MKSEDRIDLLNQNILLGINSWNGLHSAFRRETFITDEGILYSSYKTMGPNRDESQDYFVSYELTDEQMNSVYNFLESLKGCEYKNFFTRDCSHNSRIKIDGKSEYYMNDIDLYNKIHDFLGGIKNEKTK